MIDQPIIVYAMPRSQSQWIAELLDIEHEEFAISDDKVDYLLNIKGGVVDGSLIFYREFIKKKYPNAIEFGVIRDVDECVKSFKTTEVYVNQPDEAIYDVYKTLQFMIMNADIPILSYPVTVEDIEHIVNKPLDNSYNHINIDIYKRRVA